MQLAGIAVTIAELNRRVVHRFGQSGIVTGFDVGSVLVCFKDEVKSSRHAGVDSSR